MLNISESRLLNHVNCRKLAQFLAKFDKDTAKKGQQQLKEMGDRQNVCTSTQAARKQEKWQKSRENYWRQSELAAEPDSDQIVRIRMKKMRKVWFQNWKGVFFVAVQTKCNSSSYQFRLKICLASCIHSLADVRKKNVGRIASWKKRHLTAGKDPRIFNPLIQLLHH